MKIDKMGILVLVSVGVLILSVAGNLRAGEIGRYQVVSVGSAGNPAAFILDTEHGHLWAWLMTGKPGEKVKAVLTYQGQLRTGKKAGEVVHFLEIDDFSPSSPTESP